MRIASRSKINKNAVEVINFDATADIADHRLTLKQEKLWQSMTPDPRRPRMLGSLNLQCWAL